MMTAGGSTHAGADAGEMRQASTREASGTTNWVQGSMTYELCKKTNRHQRSIRHGWLWE
jgi:hypothetical protein